MKKIILLVLSIILLSGCSSTYYQYQNKENRKNISLTRDKMNVKNFDLQLVEARLGNRMSADNLKSDFLNTSDMKKMMLETINNSLNQNNYFSNSKDSYQYDIKISASRVFSAFSNNKYVGFNVEKIHIEVYKDGSVIAKKYLEGSKPSLFGGQSNTILCGQNRGFIRNLINISKMIALTKNNEDEKEDVKSCALSIYNSLIILGQ